MSNPRFTHVGLRTTDVPAASRFYGRLFGRDVRGVFQLPAPAAARGAPAHWLGFIDVGSALPSVVDRLIERGATRLGPPTDPRGTSILRDPGGATVAITSGIAWPTEPVVWHQLHTARAGQALLDYTEVFGWSATTDLDLGPIGVHKQFAFTPGEADAGSIGDIASRPELHAHWLFYFPIQGLDRAVALIPAEGGKVLSVASLSTGARIAVFEDPQGAEFGLIE